MPSIFASQSVLSWQYHSPDQIYLFAAEYLPQAHAVGNGRRQNQYSERKVFQGLQLDDFGYS